MNVQVTSSFQKHVRKTLFSIFIFILVYLILLLSTIALAGICTYIGIWAIINYPNVLTIGLGLGLIASALTILYFMIKFIFASSKNDTSDLIEVKKEDQPELFSMIDELVKEVKTDFPKKVFLSHNVNASVFYNSSFWSMFFPIRKNLQIGIGLINSLTKQELKAILAHEFGHFSQRSMKVGSYVYNVNSVIYNMLYNNESLTKIQNTLSGLSGYMALTLGLSSISINGIQKILQKLYDYVNINYMALSREMEFHADEISANVAGSKALADGLLRLNFANYAMDRAIFFYERKSAENFLPLDIYQNQHAVSLFLAEKNKYNLINGFPNVSIDDGTKYNKSKLVIENQWASHPSTEDRVKAINKLNIHIEDPEISPAIEILRNKEELFNKVQNFIFGPLKHNGEIIELDSQQSLKHFEIDFNNNEFDEIYNDFYMYNNPVISDFDKIDFNPQYIDINELFSDRNSELSLEINSLLNDKQVLENIMNRSIKLKTFDYDGVKYKANEAGNILNIVNNELNDKKAQINQLNIKIYESFFHMSKFSNKEIDLHNSYHEMKELDNNFDEKIEFYVDLTNSYAFIYHQLEYADIVINLSNNKPKEKRLKAEIADLLKNDILRNEQHPETLQMLNDFVEKDLIYFYATAYNDENLTLLFNAIHLFYDLTNRAYFIQKKLLLDLQKKIYLEFINNKSGN
ncbi:M48 family metalloprotease [Sphingobacterium endophyticum]|uniref:M48 family metalloprotease n=1 Tax=Sphingobacterium endophyticum TaxID=2546448 RepID=UPI0012E1B3CA|nr:M48 family metallopeptidase [Sphingobacterium endophyticum]